MSELEALEKHERDPLKDCEQCTGHSFKISGKCVLHYVAANHTIDEFKDAREDIEVHESLGDYWRENRKIFKERARGLFPDRMVFPTFAMNVNAVYIGDNVFWASNPRDRHPQTYHADTECPHFPDGSLRAYPESVIEARGGNVGFPQGCKYCVADSLR